MALTVLFFCRGNTCRSPLAGILASRIWPGITVVTAGLSAGHGSPASAGSCDQASDRDCDLDTHRSCPLDSRILEQVDWAIGMSSRHVEQFRDRFPAFSGKLGKLGRPGVDLMTDDDSRPAEDVDDPWRQNTELAYDLMAEQVERLLEPWGSTLTG